MKKNSLIGLLFLLIINGTLAQSDISAEIKSLTQKIENSPKSSSLYLERGKLYDQQDQFEKSASDFEKVIELYQSEEDKNTEAAVEAYTYMADDLIYRQGDAAGALSYIVRGLDLNADNKQLLLMKAEAMYRLGQNERSFNIYETLTRQYPKDLDLWMTYAEKLEKRDVKSAEKVYQQILTIDPSNEKALYFLGRYYTDISDKLNKAGGTPDEVMPVMKKGVKYLEQYFDVKPNDLAVKEALIQFYEMMGEDKKAEELKNN